MPLTAISRLYRRGDYLLYKPKHAEVKMVKVGPFDGYYMRNGVECEVVERCMIGILLRNSCFI